MWAASGLRTILLPEFISAGALRRSLMDTASKCVNLNSTDARQGPLSLFLLTPLEPLPPR